MKFNKSIIKNILKSFLLLLLIIIAYSIQNFYTIEPSGLKYGENIIGNSIMVLGIYGVIMTILFNKKISLALYTGTTRMEIFKSYLFSTFIISILIGLYISLLTYLGVEKDSSGLIFNIGSIKESILVFLVSIVGLVSLMNTVGLFNIIANKKFEIPGIFRFIALIILFLIILTLTIIHYSSIFAVIDNNLDIKFIVLELIIIVLATVLYRIILNKIYK